MKLSEAVREVEEWLDRFTYGYELSYAEVKSESEFKIGFWELSPSGSYLTDDTDFFTIEEGVLINSNGDDVTEVAQEAYSDDEETIEWVRQFVGNWYKGE